MTSRNHIVAVDGSMQQKTTEILRMSPDQAIRNDSDPEVQLFPTFGYPIAKDALWRIQIQGRISQSAPANFGKRLMLRGLIRALHIPNDVAQGELFQKRIRGFLAAPIAGARVQVELAGQHYVLRRKSKTSGLFNCKLELTSKQLQGFRTYGSVPPCPSKFPFDCWYSYKLDPFE